MNEYCRYKNGPTVKCRLPQNYKPAPAPVNLSCEYAVEQFSEIDGLPLAFSYVPMQKFENIYEIDCAFKAGTVFKDLDKPFLGRCNK